MITTSAPVPHGEEQTSMATIRRQLAHPRPSWAWQDDALCRGEDVVLFFGLDGERQSEKDVRERKAKSICDLCPSRRACLEYAVETRQVGFWGGLNDDQRKSERRRRMRRAASAGISAA